MKKYLNILNKNKNRSVKMIIIKNKKPYSTSQKKLQISLKKLLKKKLRKIILK